MRLSIPVVKMLSLKWCFWVAFFTIIFLSMSLGAPTIEDNRKGLSYLRQLVKGDDDERLRNGFPCCDRNFNDNAECVAYCEDPEGVCNYPTWICWWRCCCNGCWRSSFDSIQWSRLVILPSSTSRLRKNRYGKQDLYIFLAIHACTSEFPSFRLLEPTML